MAVIPNGVPRQAKVKSDYAIHGNPRIVVSGRIAPTKFLVEIIDAMRIVWNTVPNAELHIFGTAEPRHKDYAESVYAEAGSETGKRIFFHGRAFDVPAKLSKFDAYAVLGKDQGCPNALLEALSAGLPAIANDEGGTREQILHKETGLLIQDTSPEMLAHALLRLLQDRILAEKLGRAGKTHVRTSFSMERMAEDYLRLFKEGEKKEKAALLRWIEKRIAAIALYPKHSLKGETVS